MNTDEIDRNATDAEIRAAAKAQYQDDGQVEIDNNAELSVGNDGVYVAAWVFVRFAEEVEGES